MVGVEQKQGPLDPVFGQHRVFSLSDEAVSQEAIKYLMDVRDEALHSASIYVKSHINNDQDEQAIGMVADTSDLKVKKRILDDSESINSWINELREEMAPLDETASEIVYTDEMLDILVYEIKKYLEEHPEEVNDSVRRVTKHVQPLSNPAYDVSSELVQNMVKKLKDKRFSDISFLKRYINRPTPIPTNFRQWFGHIKHNEPTRQFMLRLSFDDLMKIQGYMMQWIVSISKNKPDSKQLQKWLLYVWIFMPNELLSQQISQLRELGKKCRTNIKLNTDIEGLDMPKEIQDIPFPNQRSELNAVEITLAVIAHRYGQQDLLNDDH